LSVGLLDYQALELRGADREPKGVCNTASVAYEGHFGVSSKASTDLTDFLGSSRLDTSPIAVLV